MKVKQAELKNEGALSRRTVDGLSPLSLEAPAPALEALNNGA